MANWEKLNKEFDEIIDNMTADEWREWKKKCDTKLSERFRKTYDEDFEKAEELIKYLDERRT